VDTASPHWAARSNAQVSFVHIFSVIQKALQHQCLLTAHVIDNQGVAGESGESHMPLYILAGNN